MFKDEATRFGRHARRPYPHATRGTHKECMIRSSDVYCTSLLEYLWAAVLEKPRFKLMPETLAAKAEGANRLWASPAQATWRKAKAS